MRMNHDLSNTNVSLQKEKRLYVFNDNNTWGIHTQRYRLPELYYPTNMKEFIAYCHDKNLFNFAQSAVSFWSKTDKDAVWSEKKAKLYGDWYTQEYCIAQTPWPMRNIKSEIELDSYIQERKELKAIELSEHLSKHVVALYDKDIPIINSGRAGYRTFSILEEMDDLVYKYNPTKVFILIGTNDLNTHTGKDQLVNNIEKMIKGIKKHRQNCKIYVESIYPVNKTDKGKIDMDKVSKRENDEITTDEYIAWKLNYKNN